MAKQKKIILAFVLAALMLALAVFAGALLLETADNAADGRMVSTDLTSDDTEMVDIVTEEGSDYALIFSSDSRQYDQTLASEISTMIRKASGVLLRAKADTVAETEYEILIGDTDRDVSKWLLATIKSHGSADEVMVWGYVYKDGKLAYTANSDLAFSYGAKEFLKLVSEDGTIRVPADALYVNSITVAEYEAMLKEQEDAERLKEIEELRQMNAQFTDDQFNTDLYTPGQFYKPIIDENGNGYFTSTKNGEPWVYPAADSHPRYLLTEDNIPTIKAILKDGENKESDYFNLAQEFWKLANTDLESIHYGVFQDKYKNTGGSSWLEPTGEPYRYDEKTLAAIDAKAMAYLITGDEKYALEAIVCIKNAMLSLHYTTDLHQDVYHGPSHVMVVLAAVYDWCYDVLTEQDKWQLIWGTAQVLGPQMENGMRYPPSGMQGVNGHGTGPQLARDWMTVATVFYDEVPDWYRYVAGRYFNEYLPVANEQFKNGWVSQGTACYAPIKIHVQAWACYLLKTSTGENFLTDDAVQTMYFFISHITPRETNVTYQEFYFQTGDGSRSEGGSQVAFAEYFVIAALYNDPVIYAQAKHITNNHKRFDYGTIFTMTPSFQLAFTSAVDYNGEGRRDGIDTIQYFADPAGQMTIREAWDDPDSVAILMRLMNKTMSNHEGYDHGTFQIYYKGLLAGTSGAYAKYGSAAHYYYQQATISSNGLLVFNPSMAAAEPVYDSDGVTVVNVATYYYSGSQRRASVGTSSVDAWLSTAEMVDTVGAAYGYYDDGRAKYAYLAGDMSNAYDDKTVDFVGRSMFTLFTGDEDFPALFFTFDRIASDEANYTKHWLLHTIKEPEIDQDNLTATVINGNGKLYLQSLYGADAITKIGGEGQAWWINGYFQDSADKGSWNVKTQSFDDENDKGSWVEGKNAVDGFATYDQYDKIWGRIELRTEGSKYSNFFNVMAITDVTNETSFEISKFKTDDDLVYGAHFKNSVVAFINDSQKPTEKWYKEFSFSTEGKGLQDYYIAGLEAGTWQIIVDGVSVAYSLVETEGALLTFVAPAGDVTVKPGNDVIGANGGKIQYSTGGGLLPKDAPYAYKNEFDFPLPTEVTRGSDIFVAWYTSPTYEPETEISFIPAGTSGTVKVYAKWISNFLNEDYSSTSVKLNAGSASLNGITYNGNTKTGSSFITKTDENGVNYLEWKEGTKDPIISQTSSDKNFSMLGSDDKCVSFTFKLATNPGNTPMQTHVRLIAKKDVYGGTISSTSTYLFTTNTSGQVSSHKGNLIAVLSEQVSTIRVVVDFKNGEMRYHDEDYNLIAVDKFTPPKTTLAENTEDFLKCLTEYLWYFYGGTPANIDDAALRIYGIRVQEGDEFASMVKPQTEGIKYNLNGGVLPVGAPKDFNEDGSMTLLPAASEMKLSGCVFDGWYTSSTFEKGTETTYVPAGYEGLYEVYAKWNKVFLNEDFSGVDIDHKEESKSYNGIAYNAAGKTGASFKTETENGKKYLVWAPGESDPLFMAQNETANVSTMADNSISYTFKISKHGTADIPNFEFRLIGKHNVAGESGKGDSNIYIGKITDGYFNLGTTATPVAQITNEIVTIRIVLDFEEGTIKAYGEFGDVIASVSMPKIPEASGAATYLEWKQCFRNYLLYTRCNGNRGADKAIRYYGIRVEEGNAFELGKDEEPPKPNSIIYETYGGTLPEDAPTEYDVQLGTILPTDVTKSGYIFGGWYKDADFSGDRIDYIPFGSQNPVKLYAKWLYIVIDETWNDKDFVHPESTNSSLGDFIYNTGSATELKPGTGFETVKDENGNVYLRAFSTSYTTFLVANQRNYYFPSFKETAVTFDFEYGRDGDKPLATNDVRLQTSGSKFGSYAFLRINGATGEAKLTGGSAAFATIGDEMVSFHIVIDFAALTVTAYGENGEILDSVALGAVPTSKAGEYQPTTWIEWMQYATGYHVYNQLSTPAGFTAEDGNVWGARFDNFRVIDGNPYINFATELPKTNAIEYQLNGGILPEGAPTEYDPEGETVLLAPTKAGSVFGGWYTTKTFEEGTRVEKIEAGADGIYTLYAKWVYVFADEGFEDKDFSSTSSAAYNKINFNLQKEGTYAETALDDQGNKYIKVYTTNSDGIVMVTNGSYNLTTMNETKLTIQLDLLPDPTNTSNISINIATSGSNYGQLKLLGASGKDGLARLNGGTEVIANIREGRTTIRLVVDFETATVYAFDADGKVLDSVELSVPKSKDGYVQPATLAEWQRLASNYLFYGYLTNPDAKVEGSVSSLGFDNILIAEGSLFDIPDAEDPTEPELPENAIIYETNGGALPTGAPTEYDPDLGVLLPTDVTKSGYIFGGWYANADFSGDRVDYVAQGTAGAVKLYAKWLKIVMDKDYENETIDVKPGSNTGITGVTYHTLNIQADLPSGNAFTTVKDDQNNTYLKIYTNSPSVIMTVNNGGAYQHKDFTETAMSFEFDYGRVGTAPLLSDDIRLETSGSNYGKYVFLKVNGATGEVKLSGSSVAFATIGAEADAKVKIRITIDFEACTVTAYGENGTVLDSVALGAVPTSKAGEYQPTTWVEWQSVAFGHLIYNQFSASEKNVDNYVYFDNLKIVDGRAYFAFASSVPSKNNIIYDVDGGKLATDAPTTYDSELGIELPVPTKNNYAFGGWYTTETFEVGTRVEKIEAGTEGAIKLYAKWNYIFASADYENSSYDGSEKDWQTVGGIQTLTKQDGTGAQISYIKTLEDESGNKYLKFSITSSDGLVIYKNSSYNLTTMKETAVSYTFDILPIDGEELLNTAIRISTDGSEYGQLNLASFGADGNVKLANSENVLGNVKEGRVSLRVTVDFAAGTITAYDADGGVIETSVLTVPKAKEGNTQPETLADWQKVAKTALLYVYMTNPTAKDGIASSVGFDNISIIEGSIFASDAKDESEEENPDDNTGAGGEGANPEDNTGAGAEGANPDDNTGAGGEGANPDDNTGAGGEGANPDDNTEAGGSAPETGDDGDNNAGATDPENGGNNGGSGNGSSGNRPIGGGSAGTILPV